MNNNRHKRAIERLGYDPRTEYDPVVVEKNYRLRCQRLQALVSKEEPWTKEEEMDFRVLSRLKPIVFISQDLLDLYRSVLAGGVTLNSEDRRSILGLEKRLQNFEALENQRMSQ